MSSTRAVSTRDLDPQRSDERKVHRYTVVYIYIYNSRLSSVVYIYTTTPRYYDPVPVHRTPCSTIVHIENILRTHHHQTPPQLHFLLTFLQQRTKSSDKTRDSIPNVCFQKMRWCSIRCAKSWITCSCWCVSSSVVGTVAAAAAAAAVFLLDIAWRTRVAVVYVT